MIRRAQKRPGLSSCRVFFDFDDTITTLDVLDDLIERFSVSREWVVLENQWRSGKIGSAECLAGQLRLVRITRAGLSAYLKTIKIDPYFPVILKLLKDKGIKPVILSDNFSFIIKSILANHGILGLRIYSNRLNFRGNRLIPAFPLRGRKCRSCAHCKKKQLLSPENRGKILIYIGDGLSDLCPASHSDLVFAKGNLLRRLRSRKAKGEVVPFKNLKKVYASLKGLSRVTV